MVLRPKTAWTPCASPGRALQRDCLECKWDSRAALHHVDTRSNMHILPGCRPAMTPALRLAYVHEGSVE